MAKGSKSQAANWPVLMPLKDLLGAVKDRLRPGHFFYGFKAEDLPEEPVPVLTFEMGEDIIRAVKDSDAGDSLRLPEAKATEASTAAQVLHLDSNPLFLVVRGYVEIYYHMRMMDRKTQWKESCPAFVAAPGDTFGEFEIDDPEAERTAGWRPYVAQAKAGFSSVYVGSRMGNSGLCDVLGISPPVHQNELSEIMYKTLRSSEWGLSPVRVELAVIPQPVLAKVLKRSKYRARFYHTFVEHARMLMKLHPQYGPLYTGSDFEKHFVTDLIPLLCRGTIPVLVDSWEYPEMQQWCRKLHSELYGKYDKLSSLNLPLNFLVPADRLTAIGAFEKAKGGNGLPPFLSRAMLNGLTCGGAGDTTKFLERIGDEARTLNAEAVLCKPVPSSQARKDRGRDLDIGQVARLQECRQALLQSFLSDTNYSGTQDLDAGGTISPDHAELFCLIPRPSDWS